MVVSLELATCVTLADRVASLTRRVCHAQSAEERFVISCVWGTGTMSGQSDSCFARVSCCWIAVVAAARTTAT